MHLHKFRPANGVGRVGLSVDESGWNLPQDGAPWLLEGSIEITPEYDRGCPFDEVENAIIRFGFYVSSASSMRF